MIIDQDFDKRLYELLLQLLWGYIQVKNCQPTVGFGDGKQELEGAVGPPHHFPRLLQCKGEHQYTIVGIHRVSKLKVVVNNLRVQDGIPSFHAINFVSVWPYVAH